MENSFNINYQKLAARDRGLIFEVARSLFLTDANKAGTIINRVLHTIRRTLTYQESAEFISRLPQYLKVMYVADWTPREQKVKIQHLDEFTDYVLQVDRESDTRVFHKEVDALSAVITVLKALNRHVHLLDLPSFSYSLQRELQETMLEPAA